MNRTRFTSYFRKALIATASMAAITASAGSAQAATFPVFQFDPSVFDVPGIGLDITTIQQADRITGTFYENLNILSATDWSASGFVVFQTIQDQNDAGINALDSGLTVTYGLYATFTASGTYTQTATGVTFNLDNATGNLYVDDFTDGNLLTDNVYDTDPTGGYTLPAPDANDALLISGIFFNALGAYSVGPPPTGSYTINFMPTRLTDTGVSCSADGVSAGSGPGCSYFIDPNPFYVLSNLSGQFANPPTSVADFLSRPTVTGSADLYFAPSPIPEPATLTLLGFGLVGVARFRRKNAKR